MTGVASGGGGGAYQRAVRVAKDRDTPDGGYAWHEYIVIGSAPLIALIISSASALEYLHIHSPSAYISQHARFIVVQSAVTITCGRILLTFLFGFVYMLISMAYGDPLAALSG